jgi:hypothetical protein
MQDLAGFPNAEVRFGTDGQPLDPQEAAGLLDFLGQGAVTDLFVFSHGWNNDMADARDLTRAFFERVRQILDAGAPPGVAGRKFAALTVLWPSKRFADRDLIPGGAASAGEPAEAALVRQQLDDLKAVFATPGASAVLEQAKALVPQLPNSPQARSQFVDLIRSLLPKDAAGREDASDVFFALPGDEVLNRLSLPTLPGAPGGAGQGGAAAVGPSPGGAAGVGSFFGGLFQGARNLLNYTTYYEMKERAGLVGMVGLNGVLCEVRARTPDVKLHLIGHSFGGRVVTAAAAGAGTVDSLTLLQAAFSHYGFASRYDGQHDGFFRAVVTGGKVSGPVLISCTKNDQAVGVAYPLASRIARQVASALGDANDPYGGIGRNGAQKTPEASNGTLLAVGGGYQFGPGKLYNLNADAVITGHSDICKPEVAYALLTAVAGV